MLESGVPTGTSIRIYLPARDGDAETLEQNTGTETVLIVEDEADLLDAWAMTC